MNSNHDDFFNAVREVLGDAVQTVTRDEIKDICAKKNVSFPHWFVNNEANRVGRGLYKMPSVGSTITNSVAAMMPRKAEPVARPLLETGKQIAVGATSATEDTSFGQSLIPVKDPTFVPFGPYPDIRDIVRARIFYSVYITGLSGNGKTFSVEQICAAEKRELIRANITIETDEDDLLGGFRLINGETVWQNGPVVTAMERGAILLLDEVDLGSNKLLCLQPVLEGKGVYLKKINKWVRPAPGFNVIATANTKGKGSDDGRFVGTNVMNEAFLERFAVTFEQDYPSTRIEEKILFNTLESVGIDTKRDEVRVFVSNLAKFGDHTRKTFMEGGLSEMISTRRLVHICKAFAIFGKTQKAIDVCIARFDAETKKAFLDFWNLLSEPAMKTTLKDTQDKEVMF